MDYYMFALWLPALALTSCPGSDFLPRLCPEFEFTLDAEVFACVKAPPQPGTMDNSSRRIVNILLAGRESSEPTERSCMMFLVHNWNKMRLVIWICDFFYRRSLWCWNYNISYPRIFNILQHCYLRILRKVIFWSLCIYLFVCYWHNSKSIKPNRMKWWDDWLLSGDHLIRFWDGSGQRLRSWKGTKKGCGEGMRSTECPF